MFGKFSRNHKKQDTFSRTKAMISGNTELSENIGKILQEKNNPTPPEVVKFNPEFLTQDDINRLPHITDWEELVDMKDKTSRTTSPYKEDVILPRMFEILPEQLLSIGETIEDVDTLLEMNHNLSYKREFNKPIEEKILMIFPSLLPQITDISLLSSWYDRVCMLPWGEKDNKLQLMVENRLRDIIWSMNGFQRQGAKDNVTKLPNIICELVDQKELEIVLEQKKWSKLYKKWDSENLHNQSLTQQVEEGIYKIIEDRTILFKENDIVDITHKLEKSQTIISEQITEALLSYLSEAIS